jgi:hypothetical protein
MRKPKPKRTGRKRGGRNAGYWFRAGRGWYTTEGLKKVPLLSEGGDHLKDREAEPEAERAYARYLLGQQERAKREAVGDTALAARVCQDYLDHCKANNRPSTFTKRGEFLFDFCDGLPARFWDYGNGRRVPKPTAADYTHDGYGGRPVGPLTPMDIQRWFDKHPTWGKGTRRIAVQGLKRVFNYAVSMGLIAKNPIRGFNAPSFGIAGEGPGPTTHCGGLSCASKVGLPRGKSSWTRTPASTLAGIRSPSGPWAATGPESP